MLFSSGRLFIGPWEKSKIELKKGKADILFGNLEVMTTRRVTAIVSSTGAVEKTGTRPVAWVSNRTDHAAWCPTPGAGVWAGSDLVWGNSEHCPVWIQLWASFSLHMKMEDW